MEPSISWWSLALSKLNAVVLAHCSIHQVTNRIPQGDVFDEHDTKKLFAGFA